MENGFTVDAMRPSCAPTMIIAAPPSVVAERQDQRDQQRVEAEGLLRRAHGGAEQREQRHDRGDQQPPRSANREASADGHLEAAGRELTEMNAPIAMMNMNTPTEPTGAHAVRSDDPVSGFCSPYRPLTGERMSC